ncbi:12586_t:CDS:2 [Acaulospora morrowiae]|uniref:12586_t:CDS:1 n=1 Tax=Acaulospora morrowiae TaxID=94023 RepID=A0A9N9F3K0_9GLOM|nr:12586_t:CDS:2 [Acaulospora morrowiae]
MALSNEISHHNASSLNATRPHLATLAGSLDLFSNQNTIPTFTDMDKPHQEPNDTPITTTNIILDYLIYLSINARLEQAKDDLKDSTKERQTAAFHRKKCQGVEAIVEGLLQSHRTQATSMMLPAPLKHRLYLCQLLHLVYDRYNMTSSSPLKSRRILNSDSANTARFNHSHVPQSTAMPTNRHRDHKLPLNLAKYEKHFKKPLLSRCRKHRLYICDACNQHDQLSIVSPLPCGDAPPTRKTASGLIDAVPVFINGSAITYRLAFEKSNSILVKSTWYDLLLNLLTQAAIECYLCDSYSSIDTLLEIFSYGDIDPSDYHSDNSESEDDDEDPHFAANRADDYLLWQRTSVLDEFRMKKKDRMKEFLNVEGKLEQHFENLAAKYPICDFETEMLAYCTNVANFMDVPALITLYKESTNNGLLVEPSQVSGDYNGGIDIPMSENEFGDLNEDYFADQHEENEENLDIENANKRPSPEGDQAMVNKKRKNEH